MYCTDRRFGAARAPAKSIAIIAALVTLAALVMFAAASLACSSCSPLSGRAKAQSAVLLDTAFAALYPSLSASLTGLSASLTSLSTEAAAEKSILVASPMSAKEIIAGTDTAAAASWRSIIVPLGDPLLFSGDQCITIVYDPVPAYTKAGGEAGRFIARERSKGSAGASCVVLFAPRSGRPQQALDAFIAAYIAAYDTIAAQGKASAAAPPPASSSGGEFSRGLVIKILQQDSLDDPEGEAKATFAALPQETVRFLFVAADRPRLAIETAHARPTVRVGFDAAEKSPFAFKKTGLAFVIGGDEKALFSLVKKALLSALSGKNIAHSYQAPSRFESNL